MDVEQAFRELRAAWFHRHVATRRPEWRYEELCEEEAREYANARLRVMFDAQTESIIAGGDACVAPLSLCDLDEQKVS